MSGLDVSPIAVMTAKVVVRAIWAAFGEEPLTVQLCLPGQQEQAWELEARRYLEYRARLRHIGKRFVAGKYVRDQQRPAVWDEEFVGEKPGVDDHILAKELPRHDVHYMSGPVRAVAGKVK